MYAHIKKILRNAYSTPPRPAANVFYVSGTIQTLSDLDFLTEKETNEMFDLLVFNWNANSPIPDELKDHYESLKVGDTIVCTKEVIFDEDILACSEIAFSVGKEYVIQGITDDEEGRILEVINDQNSSHLMDNMKDTDYFFDSYFKVK